MSPVGTVGLFHATMIYTMNALRKNADLLLKSNIIRSDDTYAKDRIRSAPLKRNGINPAVITVSNIKLNNFLRLSSLKEALRQIEKLCWWSSNTK
ncbi:unnamed protein product [Rotaria magnacalcarata]|uniref:Uncharacterized protein n=2 Tax=Rotaria magnacalcarata TaxID=392030 RepID=A0A816Y2H3_9BILA|nr:unnamed protein product [Rotaria magnacalcarata]CAF2153690.1 unnamed protein product [Rotaria magnacalcarata]CAF4095984.1 unnamed protein product [Rotaria magnacalcarata]CAF4241085.1 unnamed protein product [Rotaria magnacalcarata]CAF4308141.1 unnamed protein product [Rotaria magnacalcarata]